ncbi:50S ribosomal protein L11 methyltransferase [Deltaproteobacteria bacterium]|nr:50S ribosomal protein L11 methyltransferase [Deltaproteobacteria bacterium]
MSDLIRLTVTVAFDREDIFSGILSRLIPYGWEEETLPTGEIRAVIHTENPAGATEIKTSILSSLPDAVIAESVVPQKNWVLAWRDYFTPVPAGRRFLVLAPWMETERDAAAQTGRTVIIINPKMAFGTGHHDTTALCLAAISDLADAGRIQHGMRFLDIGAGSGILGIACAKLGLTGHGLDIDGEAIANATENREINAVPDASFMLTRGSVDAAAGRYNLIVANILAQPLISMAEDIVKRLAGDGVLVLSGLLTIQADSVIAAYKAIGLPEPVQKKAGEWTALVWS